jgi:ABC-type branched-subunit amino acid transport system ATPase component
MIRELFRTLETTLHERLSLIEQILVAVEKPKVPLYDNEFVKRIERLERQVPQSQVPDVSYLESRISALEEQLAATHAEVEELRLARVVAKEPSVILPDEDVEGEVLEDEPEEEEEAALELEPLEYRGVTYYKDADNNVYGTDEEGTVIPEPIARWNGTKLVRLT